MHLQRESHNWQQPGPPLSTPWHIDRSYIPSWLEQTVTLPEALAQTLAGWHTCVVTEKRISFLLTPPLCQAWLIQLVKHI